MSYAREPIDTTWRGYVSYDDEVPGVVKLERDDDPCCFMLDMRAVEKIYWFARNHIKGEHLVFPRRLR